MKSVLQFAGRFFIPTAFVRVVILEFIACLELPADCRTHDSNATINYNFLDYWDVPDDETSLNPPSATSAPVKNPK